jgi:hypothetical protein
MAGKPSAPFELLCPPNHGAYAKSLAQGSETHQRVLFSDLRNVGVGGCAESLEEARQTPPKAGTRSVVFLVDAAQTQFWAPYAEPHQATPGIELVALRRYDRSSLRAWATTNDAAFQDESDRAALLELTGGWSFLVALVDEAIAQGHGSAAALAQLRGRLDSEPELAETLVDVLTGAPMHLQDLFTMLAESPGTLMDPADLTELVEGTCEDPTRVVPMLRALGALRVDAEGKIGAEPHLADAWLEAVQPNEVSGQD